MLYKTEDGNGTKIGMRFEIGCVAFNRNTCKNEQKFQNIQIWSGQKPIIFI